MANLPKKKDPDLLVGFETSDDAAVYRLTDEIALVTTADFITPPVNDPFIYGQIAAANAISDIYAMGGRPISCLNLMGFPSKKLKPEVMNQIAAGAFDKIAEAGAVLAGGHTVEDDEPKFGLSVTGVVHPDKYWSNCGARPGDALILTKSIGSGVLFNANIKNWVSRDALNECLATLVTLNKTAAEVMKGFDIHAVTDITGFGLAGHSYEMAAGSQACLEFQTETLPVMRESLAMYEKGMNTGVNSFNRRQVEKNIRFDIDLPPRHQEIVYDPQTNGGLLAALPENQSDDLLAALHGAGVNDARRVGSVKTVENNILLVFR